MVRTKQRKMLSLRDKVLFTVVILIGYRLLCHIPLPFVNTDYISALMDKNSSLTFFNAITGGGFETMSFMALGISPYITASIVLQLLGVVIPRLAEMQREGSTGRQMIERITMVLAGVLGFLQAVSMTWGYGKQGLLDEYTWYTVLIPAVLMTVGVFVLSFAGQYITKHYFGNGTSLILLTGILASYFGDAATLVQTLTKDNPLWQGVIYCMIALFGVLLLFGFSFYLNYCEKKIPVTYSQRTAVTEGVFAQTSIIPLKLLSGSVVPIIFASTLFSFPMLIQSFTGTDVKWLWIFDMTKWFHAEYLWTSCGIVIYCILIVWFSYYYNHLNLNEVELANQLKKHGGYIHGIRPGKPTSDYLKCQLKYMTFLGGLGLCVIAIVPTFVISVLGIPQLAFLGTSIIITVSVIVETQKRFVTEYQSYGFHHKRSVAQPVSDRSIFGSKIVVKNGKEHGTHA